MANGDYLLENSLREEIAVMRHAINQVAGTLPIGARQAAILDQIMIDLQLDPRNRKVFPTNNHGLIFSRLSVPEATLSASSSPSNTNSTPTHSAGGTRKTTAGGPTSSNSNSSGGGGGGGEQLQQQQQQGGVSAGWATSGNGENGGNGGAGGMDGTDRMMEEMQEMQAPWEGFNRPI